MPSSTRKAQHLSRLDPANLPTPTLQTITPQHPDEKQHPSSQPLSSLQLQLQSLQQQFQQQQQFISQFQQLFQIYLQINSLFSGQIYQTRRQIDKQMVKYIHKHDVYNDYFKDPLYRQSQYIGQNV